MRDKNARCEIKKCEMRDKKCEIKMRDKNARCEVKKCEMRDKKCEIKNARCEIDFCEIPGLAPWSRNLTGDTATTTWPRTIMTKR